jgi:Na+/H+ antiporter NhaA
VIRAARCPSSPPWWALVPALIYTAVQRRQPAGCGWGHPDGTDIAFAVALITRWAAGPTRVPRLFLAHRLAIVDDLARSW